MSISPLDGKLRAAFSECSKVEHEIYRCVLRYRSRPRSIYFFRSVSRLPDDAELAHWNEVVISPSYFSAHDELRWNIYLVLVAENEGEDSVFSERKRAIEANRSYARKLVLHLSELDNFLDRRDPQPHPEALGGSILDVWYRTLEAAGLSDIATDVSRARVIRSIRSGELVRGNGGPAPIVEGAPVLGMEKLDVEQFGSRKLAGVYNFGRVTLIRGPNGSGKTSLLECIEHFYCGATNRSKGKAEILRATGYPTSGGKPIAYEQLSNDEFQARDRAWYGRLTNKGNRLWEGFARYNFLDADAAVNFTNDSDLRDIKEALSRVALGPSASYIWNRLLEFSGDLEREIAPLKKSIRDLGEAKTDALERIAALRAGSPQARATVDIVRDGLQSIGWPFTLDSADSPDSEWFRSLAPLQNFVAAHQRAGSPSNLVEVGERRDQIASDLMLASKIGIEITSSATEKAKAERALAESEAHIRKMQRLREYFRTSFQDAYEALKECERERTRLVAVVIPEAELDELARVLSDSAEDGISSTEAAVRLRTELSSVRESVEALGRRRHDIVRGAHALQSLESQIRALGLQYAKEARDVHGCPLCGTVMETDELRESISRLASFDSLSPQMEALADMELRSQARVSELSGALRTIERLISTADPRSSMAVGELLKNSRRLQAHVDHLGRIIAQAKSMLDALAQAGFSPAEYEQLQSLVIRTQKDSDTAASASADLEVDIARVEAEVALLREAIARCQERERELFDQLLAMVQKNGIRSASADDLRDALQRELGSVHGLIKAFEALPTPVRSASTNLDQLRTRSDALLAKVESLNRQLQQERAQADQIRLLLDQVAKIELRQGVHTAECGRLEDAYQTLRNLQDSQSLSSALDTFLASNLEAIQDIFSRIHCPRELKVSDLANCTLERSGTQQGVSLTEISTGQRAAFVLSVFLMLNLSLRNGPPVILIDDPIAHVDDLNSLLFLDFLADIAERGNRQIFFATASEKLANLFEKKLAFLGDEFSVLSMPRMQMH